MIIFASSFFSFFLSHTLSFFFLVFRCTIRHSCIIIFLFLGGLILRCYYFLLACFFVLFYIVEVCVSLCHCLWVRRLVVLVIWAV